MLSGHLALTAAALFTGAMTWTGEDNRFDQSQGTAVR
jgi:hypothetical protein